MKEEKSFFFLINVLIFFKESVYSVKIPVGDRIVADRLFFFIFDKVVYPSVYIYLHNSQVSILITWKNIFFFNSFSCTMCKEGKFV